jgi:hypothetical protein
MGNSHTEPGAAADRGFVTLPIRQEQLSRINRRRAEAMKAASTSPM